MARQSVSSHSGQEGQHAGADRRSRQLAGKDRRSSITSYSPAPVAVELGTNVSDAFFIVWLVYNLYSGGIYSVKLLEYIR